MALLISDIIKMMEMIAPAYLAEKWDNVGLQVGQREWPVKTVLIALDPLHDVVAAACNNGYDLLITHHPLFFEPLKSIDLSTRTGSIINMALAHKLSIFAAHTNLDRATSGTSEILSKMIGLTKLKVMENGPKPNYYKLVIYAPVAYQNKIFDSLFETNFETKAGKIGNYDYCSFITRGTGTFKPGSLSKPFTGEPGKVSHTDEVRIETIVQKKNLQSVIENVKKNHPYETMAYDIYPLLNNQADIAGVQIGFGRVGRLEKASTLALFALKIKKTLGLKYLKITGDPDLTVTRAAVCAGSGSSMMGSFFSSGAEVYVSGDLRYHDAREAEAQNKGLIDIGHFASEHLIVKSLADRLKTILEKTGTDVRVEACETENDPFKIL